VVPKKAAAVMCFVRCALVTLGLLYAGLSAAQQALVRSYDNSALEIGQSYLTHYGSRCLAVLPTHVSIEAGEVAAFLREGTSPLLGESMKVTDLGDDVSIADVTGGLTSSCGYSSASVSRAVDSRLKDSAIASIRSVSGDGSIAQMAVAIIDDDGNTFLRVQPLNDVNQLRKGQSGSLLMSGDTPIGMLLSVDSRFGFGKVIRFDIMFRKIDSYLVDSASVVRASSRTAPALRKGESDRDSIVSWSAMAVDAEHRASNLVGTEGAPAWIAKVEQWPVEIEMDLAGDRVAIEGIRLDAVGIEDTSTLPAIVELMVSNTESGQRWRSVAGGAVDFAEGNATILFAPIWARQVKLVISETSGGGNIVALRRLIIFPAN